MAAYAARAGLTPIVLIPQGKIAAGKMAQAIVHGAQLIMVRGNFDHCLQLARAARRGLPGRPGQLGQPGPARRARRPPRSRSSTSSATPPTVHVLPVGNAGNIAAYWKGYREYADLGRATTQAGDARLPGRGRRAAGDRRAVPRPRDQGDRDPDRQPRVVEARRGRPRRVRWPVRGASATRRSWPRSASSPPATACSSSRRRQPGSPGCSPTSRRASPTPGSTVVITVTGHGLKDIDTALEASGRWSTPSSTPTSTQAAAAAGLRLSCVTFVHGPGHGRRAGHRRQPRPGLRLPRARARPARRGHRPRCAGSRARRSRSPARAPTTCRATSPTWSCGRCGRRSTRWGRSRPACG